MEKLIAKPKRVIVEITDKCNFRCKHCFANKNDFELKLQSWKKIFDSICRSKIESITITGGEPLLYKDFFTLLKQVKIRKTKFTLDSNASLINENNILLIEKYFKKIRVSYYGIGRAWHANTQSNSCSEEKFLKALRILCDSKVKVQVKIPLFENNVKNLFKMLDTLKEYNVDEIVLIPIIPYGKASKLDKQLGYNGARRLLKEYGDKERDIRVFRWAKGKHFLIRSNGTVVLHPPLHKGESVLGNILDRDINELWNTIPEKYQEVHQKLTTKI